MGHKDPSLLSSVDGDVYEHVAHCLHDVRETKDSAQIRNVRRCKVGNVEVLGDCLGC